MTWKHAGCVMAIFAASVRSSIAAAPEMAVRGVGEYSTMRQDAEHCSGYRVILWKAAGKIYGVFSACSGLVGDIPSGVLEETDYDTRTGALRFQAHLSLGSDYVGGGKQIPSKDVFFFKGRISRRMLRGLLRHVDEAYEKKMPSTMRVTMRQRGVRLKEYGSVESWRQEQPQIGTIR
jgi:hypothetical protein